MRTRPPLRPSRPALFAGVLLATALVACEARAQFANHSIGFEVGGVFVANPAALNVGSGGDLGVNATLYIENGFDLYFRALVGLHRQRIPAANVVGFGVDVGVRYLFSEDTVRPYIGLNLGYSGFLLTEEAGSDAHGMSLNPMGGIEFFVAENFSIGLQVEYHLMILSLNDPPEHGLAGLVRMGWYF